MLNNIIPVTLGNNVFAAAVFVAIHFYARRSGVKARREGVHRYSLKE